MDELYELIAAIVERDRDEPDINAGWVAHEAMQTVDPDRVSVPCVYGGCSEHAKQYARGLLRKKFEIHPDDIEKNPQLELFTALQWRYPRRPVRGEDRSYVLLDLMIDDDVDYNEQWLLNVSEATAKHARALRAYWNGRRRSA